MIYKILYLILLVCGMVLVALGTYSLLSGEAVLDSLIALIGGAVVVALSLWCLGDSLKRKGNRHG